MKAILCFLAIGTVILLGSITRTTGQDYPQPRFTSPVAEDHLCDSDHNFCHVNDLTDCVVVPFFGSEGVGGRLKVSVVCSGIQNHACGNCLACSYVREHAGGVLRAQAFTPFNPCAVPCDGGPGNFEMHAMWYDLVVCLRSCTGDCNDCSASCYAYATVTAG